MLALNEINVVAFIAKHTHTHTPTAHPLLMGAAIKLLHKLVVSGVVTAKNRTLFKCCQ